MGVRAFIPELPVRGLNKSVIRRLSRLEKSNVIWIQYAHWFLSIKDAGEKIESWREKCNTFRPYSSLGDLTPQEFAEKHAAGPEIYPVFLESDRCRKWVRLNVQKLNFRNGLNIGFGQDDLPIS